MVHHEDRLSLVKKGLYVMLSIDGEACWLLLTHLISDWQDVLHSDVFGGEESLQGLMGLIELLVADGQVGQDDESGDRMGDVVTHG